LALPRTEILVPSGWQQQLPVQLQAGLSQVLLQQSAIRVFADPTAEVAREAKQQSGKVRRASSCARRAQATLSCPSVDRVNKGKRSYEPQVLGGGAWLAMPRVMQRVHDVDTADTQALRKY